MEIEVGDYVRTKINGIRKIRKIDIDDDNEKYYYFTQNVCEGTYETNIIKHSKNIIDLIEVGDFINGEVVWSTNNEKGIETVSGYYTEKDIKSILTKEQFEQDSYKVEE